MNNKMFTIITAGIVVTAVAVTVFVLINKSGTTDKSSSQNINSEQSSKQNSSSTQKTTVGSLKAEVTLTGSGFEPNSVKIKAGGTVVWTNKSGKEATINSDPHPTHFLWPFLNLGNFGNDQSMSSVFEKKGVYTYHNHLDPNIKGTVTVE